MKRGLITAVIAILLACSSTNSNAEIIEFEFHDVSGKTYKNNTIENQLMAEYGTSFKGIKLLLIETPSFDNPIYEKQNKIIDSLPHGEAEELRILYVIACTEAEYKHGYHTSIMTAKILSQAHDGFRIRLLDSRGFIHFESTQPVSAEKLRYWAKELDKK